MDCLIEPAQGLNELYTCNGKVKDKLVAHQDIMWNVLNSNQWDPLE